MGHVCHCCSSRTAQVHFKWEGEVRLEPTMRYGVSVSHGVAGVVAGALFGLALGLVGLAALGEARSLLLIPPLALLGGLVGWSLRGGRCSSCRAQIGDQDVLCPGCGGLVTD